MHAPKDLVYCLERVLETGRGRLFLSQPVHSQLVIELVDMFHLPPLVHSGVISAFPLGTQSVLLVGLHVTDVS